MGAMVGQGQFICCCSKLLGDSHHLNVVLRVQRGGSSLSPTVTKLLCFSGVMLQGSCGSNDRPWGEPRPSPAQGKAPGLRPRPPGTRVLSWDARFLVPVPCALARDEAALVPCLELGAFLAPAVGFLSPGLSRALGGGCGGSEWVCRKGRGHTEPVKLCPSPAKPGAGQEPGSSAGGQRGGPGPGTSPPRLFMLTMARSIVG